MLRQIVAAASLALSLSSVAATISAKSVLIADIDTGEVIYAKNNQAQRSIASITKMVTVMTVLDAQQSLNEELDIQRTRNVSTYMPAHLKRLPRSKLIEMSMVSSDNTAAYTLCYHYVGGYHECIRAMNRLVRSWGAQHTEFMDPTGLFNQDVSTAEDLALILKHSLDYPFLKAYGARPTASIELQAKNPKHKPAELVYANTNRLLKTRRDILVTKTGWITASGGCIAMIVNRYNRNFAVVLLGSENTRTRLSEANQLIENYILPVM